MKRRTLVVATFLILCCVGCRRSHKEVEQTDRSNWLTPGGDSSGNTVFSEEAVRECVKPTIRRRSGRVRVLVDASGSIV
ncbi:MAG TPA: hypothetical protein VFN10_15455, partial [Thermoanaerobaculia bacterium]|nr:hypothetical protein [Thermoanaerobaculia bacterium]